MLIVEYRIVMPFTVAEYQIGQLYTVAQASVNETGGGEGVEVLKNEPFEGTPLFDGRFGSGQYTLKTYFFKKKAPGWLARLAPHGALELHESAWNAYPYCRTILTNPFLKDKFKISVETLHQDDLGTQENVHLLPPESLEKRKVVFIDIGNDPVAGPDYNPREDPRLFVSVKTGRGPLVDDWQSGVVPAMTCYKLVVAECRWFGLQNRIEKLIHKSERRIFTVFHRKMFCWMDDWIELTMDDIRAIENQAEGEMRDQINQGELRGLTGADED